MIDVQELDVWGWRGVSLSSGHVSLILTPDVGGRIVSFKLDGIEAFFTLPELRGRRFNVAQAADVRAKKKELGWLHYGGYKTWLAPQDHWTDGLPFLDLDSGSYDVAVQAGPQGCTVCMTSPVCRETGMQLTRRVSMFEGGSVVVHQAMTNRSSEYVRWGLWDVTQVKGPGLAVLPVAERSQFKGGVKAYTSEGRSPEVMNLYVGVSGGLAIVTCSEIEPIKYGTDSTEGWIAGLLDRQPDHWLAYYKVFEPKRGARYPHKVTGEVYDSGTYPYFELEVHSPLIPLAPRETYAYSETWTLEWLPKFVRTQDLRGWIKKAMRREIKRS